MNGRSGQSISLVLFALAAISVAAGQTTPETTKPNAASAWSVRWQPLRLVNGAPIVFRVAPPARLESLSGDWLGHQVFFSRDPRGKAWYGIAGVSLETAAGVYSLRLKGETASGKELSFEQRLTVQRARYPSIAVEVSKRFTEPNPEQLQTIAKDKKVKQDVFKSMTPEREWSGAFDAPVTARVSDVFGTRRVFNGKTQSVHEGLDYAVPQGTPVSALNSGTVLLAGPLYFEGNCVVLDHGQGLLTLYLHLSEFKVQEGDQVKRGQEIGVSGGTGRATGPHLHIAVRWQGVYVDPATLLKLNLP